MIDRQQLEAILGRRFPGAPIEQIAAAANAIMGLEREGRAQGHRRPGGCTCGARTRKRRDEVAPPLPPTAA